jgi:hypothetical protein
VSPAYFEFVTQACAVEMREGFQNSLGWPVGILRPSIVFVEVADKIVTDAKAVFDASAELVAVTVTSAGEGAAEGAV